MALFDAVLSGDVERVATLLTGSPEAAHAVETSCMWTPLHCAVYGNFMEIVKLLLAHGANVNSSSAYENTPLIAALIYASDDIVALLLANGADVNTKDELGMTPLHICVGRGRGSVIELLLKNGADVDSCCALGRTPLRLAIDRYRADYARVLIEAGATISPAILEVARCNNMDFVVAAAARWGSDSL